MDEAVARSRFAGARVARLATVRRDGRPHVVAVCFAVVDDRIVTAVDAKPKSTRALARLDNIAAHPTVSLLVDHYDDDWSQLWWVRADGIARIVDITTQYLEALAAKYPQYEEHPPAGPAIVVAVDRWSGWSYARY